MQLPYSQSVDTKFLSRLFDNTSECYKFFWFKAILTKLKEGKTDIWFEELVNEMIADAWYMVSEYHLNLGPRDNLEQLVNYLNETTKLKPAEDKKNILIFLRDCQDKTVLNYKKILIGHVPYRLQAPLMPEMSNADYSGGKQDCINRINMQRRLMYYFGRFNGLSTSIHIQPNWADYFSANREIVAGWLQFNMIIYLQRRNPNVPGIADKLYPPHERKLERVKKYWRLIMELQPIYEIYGNNLLEKTDLSIDHFVPWSYVAHDELWNLHPTTRSINSSKSNFLPDWKRYFDLFAAQEYNAYQVLWKYEKVHDEFRQCSKEHLNCSEIKERLYRRGLKEEEFKYQLSNIIMPVYETAENCGFRRWTYHVK